MKEIISKIEQSVRAASKVYLYGAGIIAYGVRCALRELWQVEIAGHIVSSLGNDQQDFQGKPVLALADFPAHVSDALILIATPPEYQEEIAVLLQQHTDCRFILLDNDGQFALMSRYYQQIWKFRLVKDLPLASTFEIYMARSAQDKPLYENIELPSYIYPVQAGASIDTDHLSDMWHDDDGKNISPRNRDYSEMTVTYWAWKNRRADWQGICHYRRVLGLSDADYQVLAASDADVVLPLPYRCAGDASFQYRRYISSEDMELLYSVMDSHEQEILRRELSKPYLYNHNLLLARRDVFVDYCEHIFSILQRVDEAESVRPWRNDRHMGYLAEILTSAYFTSRANRLHIVHAPELWLV